MAVKKPKRMTQREKDERAATRKRLREMGMIPPRKALLNRKKFAAEVLKEYKKCDWVGFSFYLHQAIGCTVDESMLKAEADRITSEQIGVLKLIKLALETKHFHEALKEAGRSTYSVKEYLEQVYDPVMKL